VLKDIIGEKWPHLEVRTQLTTRTKIRLAG